MFVSALIISILGLIWWVWIRAQERDEKIVACTHHQYKYISLYNQGVWWVKICELCPFQEVVRDPDKIKELRQ